MGRKSFHRNIGLISVVAIVAVLATTHHVTQASRNRNSTDANTTQCTQDCLLSNSSSPEGRSSRDLKSSGGGSSKFGESVRHSYRLPESVVPTSYFLTITPILEPEETLGKLWDAPGSVVITTEATRVTNVITFHSKNITIHNVSVAHNSERIPVRNMTRKERHSFLALHLEEDLVPGEKYVIIVNFTSYVSPALNGLFRSSYVNPDTGKQEWFAATHMEALHARQMFPCFDEPGLKASIQAKIGRKSSHVALFNTESIKNETMPNSDSYVWETFAPTVPMSTYLTALVVGRFSYFEAPGKLLPQVRVRTYAPPHEVAGGGAEYPSRVAETILHAYGDYFKEGFPMSKFDSVGVPSFLYGAMENFGLSIFRENLLLHFPNRSTETQRYIVTMVLAHEIGHQWFGNMVTMNWWTHLWLSEGLTKFTEYIGLNATIPEFLPWDLFLLESLQAGLRLDADPKTSHSLKIDEDSWALKSEMDWFDDIAYKKGGSLVRMMQGFLSEPVLRKGLSRYLSRLKFKSALQDDLFADCDKEARLSHKLPQNTTLRQIMSAWTSKSGFPLLRASLQEGTDRHIVVTQEKYFSSPQNAQLNSGQKKWKWFIPVSVATSSRPNFDPEPEFWMRTNETKVQLQVPADSWVILNAGTTGFYRVIYDETLTSRIVDQLREFPEKIHRYARSQLLDDYFNAAWNRYLPVQRALNLTLYMNDHAELEHIVWSSLLLHLKPVYRLLQENPDEFRALQTYLLPRLEKAMLAISGGYHGVTQDTVGLSVARHAQLIDWLCNLEGRSCLEYAKEKVQNWRKSGVLSVPRDFRSVILSAAVAHDNSGSIFDFVTDQYRILASSSSKDDDKLRSELVTALGTTRDKQRIKELLDILTLKTNDSWFQHQDAGTLLQSSASHPSTAEVMLSYLVDDFERITSHIGGLSTIVGTLGAMAPQLKSVNSLFLIEKLIELHGPTLKQALASPTARIKANIVWFDDFGEDMLEFFQNNK